jgi:carbonic anhydrase
MNPFVTSLAVPSLLLRLFAAPLGGAVAAETACPGGSCLNAAGDEEATLMQLKTKPAQEASAKAGGDFNYRSFHVGDWPSVVVPDQTNMCDGTTPGGFQSPINIQVAKASYKTSDIPGPKFFAKDGGCSEALFVNKSNAWQVDTYDPKNEAESVTCSNLILEWNGKDYEMIQFHFHTLSEDTFDFKPFPMQMHMVHVSADNSIAVVGVLIDTHGPASKQNNFLNWVFETGFDSTRMVSAPGHSPVNPYKALLKKHGEFWHYPGSLTTPPCSQGLDFFIAKDPVTVSETYVEELMNYLKPPRAGNSYGQNHRPIQPLNGREITVGRWTEVCPLTGEIPEVGELDPDFCHFVEEWA